jgi:hypothetical protein
VQAGECLRSWRINKLITWFIIEWRISSSGALFPTPSLVNFNTRFLNHL